MDNQNLVGLLGRNFVAKRFVTLKCKEITLIVISLWGRKFMRKGNHKIHEY